jgi:hydrogenase expression/formation protein HypC
MCLSIPGQIKEIRLEGSLPMGSVDFGGVVREVCLDYVPEAKVGQYVLVHVGFAISVMDEEEAQETLELLRQMAEVEDELKPDNS